MEQPSSAALEEFVSHLDDALEAAVAGEAGGTLAASEVLVKALPEIERWKDQIGVDSSPDEDSVRAVRELQQKAYRLARVVRHVQSVRQGLDDIGKARIDCYESDAGAQELGTVRLRVDG